MFHFTIRDLLWLTMVIALAVGWWNEYRSFVSWRESVSGDFKVPPGHGTSQVKIPPLPDRRHQAAAKL